VSHDMVEEFTNLGDSHAPLKSMVLRLLLTKQSVKTKLEEVSTSLVTIQAFVAVVDPKVLAVAPLVGRLAAAAMQNQTWHWSLLS